jgi:hypothetical protein
MRYHYKKPDFYVEQYGSVYACEHPIYSKCTLFTIKNKGLAVIQQRFDPEAKHTWWGHIDTWLANDLYLNEGFKKYFDKRSGECINGLYPTVSVRQIMWALKMKPLKKERWETVFDRRFI